MLVISVRKYINTLIGYFQEDLNELLIGSSFA